MRDGVVKNGGRLGGSFRPSAGLVKSGVTICSRQPGFSVESRPAMSLSLKEISFDFANDIHLCTQAIAQKQNLLYVFWGRGTFYRAQGEFDKAINDFDDAVRLDPKNITALILRGSTWQAKGEYDKALADFNEAVRLAPKKSDGYFNRSGAWHVMGEYDKAIADCEEVIKLEPRFALAYNQRAWIRATCPNEKYRDGAKAVDDATKACDLTEWEMPKYLDTLAAAYAEAGQFGKAVEWLEKAIDLASDEDDFGTRLALYQAGKPYREEPGKK
jgi:tetratricopeptide (TPR) repeat protein